MRILGRVRVRIRFGLALALLAAAIGGATVARAHHDASGSTFVDLSFRSAALGR